MVDALSQAEDSGGRQAALVHFVERVGADEADALRRALAELEANQRNTPSGWRYSGELRDTYGVSALAFTILAVLLVGPVPALLARATWPLRAPRAAMVLWQAVALAAVLSAFSAGIAIATRVLMPGSDGRPTASVIGAEGRLGWPLWTAYLAVFALTVLVGARLVISVVQVATANRRRGPTTAWWSIWSGSDTTPLSPSRARGRVTFASWTFRSRLRTASRACAAAWWSAKEPWPPSPTPRSRPSSPTSGPICAPGMTWCWRPSPRCTPPSRGWSAAPTRYGAVQLLVELLADDAAVRATGRTPLARALVACASGRAPSGALAAGGPSTVLRVRRLSGRGNSLPLSAAAYLAAVAVFVVPTVALAVPWLTELRRLLNL